MGIRRLSFDKWVDHFKPLVNPFTESAGCSGYLFDDFGDAATFVRQQESAHVWTLTITDGDRSSAWEICNGKALVNRFGYLVTGRPWQPDHFYRVRY